MTRLSHGPIAAVAVFLVAVMSTAAAAFHASPQYSPMKRASFVSPPHVPSRAKPLPAQSRSQSRNHHRRQAARRMASGDDESSDKAKVNPDGTVYDDEVEQYRDPLSSSMRERLLREASTGLDADKKQTNVLLYICIGVAVLVLLGGQGILY